MHPYGDKVTIETEKILGEEPPRADYLVLVKDKDVSLEKEIFKIFRTGRRASPGGLSGSCQR